MDQGQPKENQARNRRDQFGIEIRNRGRLALFQQKRDQLASINSIDVQYLYSRREDFENITTIQQCQELLGNQTNLKQFVESLNVLSLKKLPVYDHLKPINFDLLLRVATLIDINDAYLSYLAYYTIQNLLSKQTEAEEIESYNHPSFMMFCTGIQQSTFEFIKQQNFQVSAYGLFTLSNIFSNEQILRKLPILQNEIANMVRLLKRMVSESNQLTQNQAHGILWLLRNYTQISEQPFIEMLDIVQILFPIILQIQDRKLKLETCEDAFIILQNIAKKMNDCELSNLFSTHIQLLISTVVTKWPKELYEEVALFFNFLLYGQDDVIEQMINLGIAEVLMQFMQEGADEAVAATLGCISNIFQAEDEDLIVQFLQQYPVVKELIFRSRPGNGLDVREEAARAIANLLKGYHQSAELVVKYDGIQALLLSLQETYENMDLVTEVMSSLYALIQYDDSTLQGQMDQEGQIKQAIITLGGLELLTKYLDYHSVAIQQLANQLISQLQE